MGVYYMSKIFLILSIITFSIIETGCQEESIAPITVSVLGDFPHYSSIKDLALKSAHVVRLEIIDERVEISERRFEEETYRCRRNVYTARVLDVYQGDLKINDSIENFSTRKHNSVLFRRKLY